MLYLSRLLLNPRSRAVRRDLADCHGLHRTILRAFPTALSGAAHAREQFGILYRLDHDGRIPDRLALLVQSRLAPDWSFLEPGYLLDATGVTENPATKPIDHLHALIHAGLVLRFRLRANPTRKIAATAENGEKRRNGMRVELRDQEKLLGWLARKGTQHGFDLWSTVSNGPANVRVVVEDKVTGKRAGEQTAAQVVERTALTFGSVLFEGVLRVTDADAFRLALESGIGSGKAYGFGLLSLARY